METSWRGLFVLLTPFITSGILGQTIGELEMESRVFLALSGEDLDIQFEVVQPVNHSGTVECFNSANNSIHSFKPTQPTATVNVRLTNVTSANTGEYHCQYETAAVYWWTVLVRDEGYREQPSMSGYRGVAIVGAVALVLLILDVAGSVYVFCWHNEPAGDESANTSGTRVQGTEQRREESRGEDMAAASDSFYTSLQSRPVSVYEVLNNSAVAADMGAGQVLPRSNRHLQQVEVEHGTHHENDGEFESVYENF